MNRHYGTTSKRIRFKDELRRSLLGHSFIPVAVITVVFLFFLYFSWRSFLVASTKKAGTDFSLKLDKLIADYGSQLERLSGTLDVQRIHTDVPYTVEVNTGLYHFLNGQSVRGTFYLFDSAFSLQISSEIQQTARERNAARIAWVCQHYLLQSGRSSVLLLWNMEAVCPVLCMCRRLSNGSGYLCFTISPDTMPAFAAGQPVFLVVTDEFGRIYWENTVLFEYSFNKLRPEIRSGWGFVPCEGQTYYVFPASIRNGLLHVYAVRDTKSIHDMFAVLGILIAVIFSVMILTIWFSAHHVAQQKTKIIDTIVEAFKSATAGDLTRRLEISSPEEFAIIGHSYNSMLESLRTLIQTNEEQMQQALTSNLRQMQAQFNAHFLFNTLETVRFLSHLNPSAVETIVVCLSDLLRYSINTAREMVTLREDIGNVENYLTILSYRFSSRLSYRITIPDALQNCRVPKLIFQPIVENAVKYGLEEKDSILVGIAAVADPTDLCISITDNGPGIAPEVLARLMKNLQENTPDGHIGIYNVHRRLFLLFGAGYGVSIHSNRGCGTTVQLHLPLAEGEAVRSC